MSDTDTPTPTWATETSINSFIRYLNSSKRILILSGAGLSAPSGIPTFQGSGQCWKGFKASNLSNIEVFNANPGLVWKYFATRRRLALRAKPNRAHVILAEAAKKRKGMRLLTQNIDGLSQRARHPKDRLYELHGSLLDIKCTNPTCDYYDKENTTEPLCPALAADEDELALFSPHEKEENKSPSPPSEELSSLSLNSKSKEPKYKESTRTDRKPAYEKRLNPLQDIIDSLAPIITPEMSQELIPLASLPHCPKCTSLLRPAVIMFGESLSQIQYDEITTWLDSEKRLDLMMVIGTQAEVFPAARFVGMAREKGARIAVVNIEEGRTGGWSLREGKDWGFWGDVVEVLEVLFEGVLLNG